MTQPARAEQRVQRTLFSCALMRDDIGLMNEAIQNLDLPPQIRMKVESGVHCDQLEHGTGEYGRDQYNPIPVNGPLGEITYLSLLRTSNGSRVMFHRLGSYPAYDDETDEHFTFDAYEVMSFDGLINERLYFDMYHPNRSRKAPEGYTLATRLDFKSLWTGVNVYVENFPVGLDDAVASLLRNSFYINFPATEIEQYLGKGQAKDLRRH